jgi:hypothetical protein
MRDELLERVVSELQNLPPVDEAAVSRIVQAAGGQQAEGGVRRASVLRSWWRSRVPLAAAAGLALAAGIGGFLAGDILDSKPTPTMAAAGASAAESVRLVAAVPSPALRPTPDVVPTQFVLDAPDASRVALVGDFNGWDGTATPLKRDPSSGIWTATVRLPAGRHVYAFMVDGSELTLDPRAPTAQDPDFGTPSSVVLVGAP